MSYHPERHHRRSVRLKGYDYRMPGAYFMTICTVRRNQIFGQIVASQMVLSASGSIATQIWHALPRHSLHVALDAFVVMPDHIHGIIVLKPQAAQSGAWPQGRPRGTVARSLSAVIQNFKSVTARRINQKHGTPGQRVWQEDFYEHIVRDERDLTRIRQYIAANPSRWHGPP